MQLEHINLRVPSIARTRALLLAAFPDFRERGNGYSDHYGYWSHIGNDSSYLSLYQADRPGTEPPATIPPYSAGEQYRLMHVGFTVDDIERVIARLGEAGFEPYDISDLDSHPFRRRVYYLDGNGIEFEFVEYLSDNPTERNDYSR